MQYIHVGYTTENLFTCAVSNIGQEGENVFSLSNLKLRLNPTLDCSQTLLL